MKTPVAHDRWDAVCRFYGTTLAGKPQKTVDACLRAVHKLGAELQRHHLLARVIAYGVQQKGVHKAACEVILKELLRWLKEEAPSTAGLSCLPSARDPFDTVLNALRGVGPAENRCICAESAAYLDNAKSFLAELSSFLEEDRRGAGPAGEMGPTGKTPEATPEAVEMVSVGEAPEATPEAVDAAHPPERDDALPVPESSWAWSGIEAERVINADALVFRDLASIGGNNLDVNLGLVWDRLMPDLYGRDTEKKSLLERFVRISKRCGGAQASFEEEATRRRAIYLDAGFFEVTMRLKSPLCVGVSNAGHFGDGRVALHRYGFPYIPAESFWGVERAGLYKEQQSEACAKGYSSPVLVGLDDPLKSDLAWLLESRSGKAMRVIVSSLWPTEWHNPFFVICNQTPHSTKLIEANDPQKALIGDPVPFFFPAVKSGISFSVYVKTLQQDLEGKIKEFLCALFKETLPIWGVGARKKTGYGRMTRIELNEKKKKDKPHHGKTGGSTP